MYRRKSWNVLNVSWSKYICFKERAVYVIYLQSVHSKLNSKLQNLFNLCLLKLLVSLSINCCTYEDIFLLHCLTAFGFPTLIQVAADELNTFINGKHRDCSSCYFTVTKLVLKNNKSAILSSSKKDGMAIQAISQQHIISH